MHYAAYCLSYAMWSVWSLAEGRFLPSGLVPPIVMEAALRTLIWIGPMLLLGYRKDQWLIRPGKMLQGSFPWHAAFVGLCLTAVFLHTAHIVLVGIDVWGIFDPIWIWLSLSAAVIEEIAFRGFLFNWQAAKGGIVRTAVVNGLLFAVYHYPEFIVGRSLWAVFGFRFWMIAVMGFLFSVMFARWKHLGLTILIHFAWNLLCFWFALA